MVNTTKWHKLTFPILFSVVKSQSIYSVKFRRTFWIGIRGGWQKVLHPCLHVGAKAWHHPPHLSNILPRADKNREKFQVTWTLATTAPRLLCHQCCHQNSELCHYPILPHLFRIIPAQLPLLPPLWSPLLKWWCFPECRRLSTQLHQILPRCLALQGRDVRFENLNYSNGFELSLEKNQLANNINLFRAVTNMTTYQNYEAGVAYVPAQELGPCDPQLSRFHVSPPHPRHVAADNPGGRVSSTTGTLLNNNKVSHAESGWIYGTQSRLPKKLSLPKKVEIKRNTLNIYWL